MKESMNSKEQTIYCIIVVFVLILLAFGDQIVLSKLPKNPNPNDRVFKDLVHEKTKYSFIEEISVSEVFEKLKHQESFYLLFLREDCYTCDKVLEKMNSFSSSIQYPVYFLYREQYSTQEEEFQTLLQYDLRILENESLTPFFVQFEQGIVMDTLVGMGKKNRLEEFLCKNN